jgi:30S ribosomal protein S31
VRCRLRVSAVDCRACINAASKIAFAALYTGYEQHTFEELGFMGKGDVRSRRGKIYNGSYGKRRPHRARKPAQAAAAPRPAKGR